MRHCEDRVHIDVAAAQQGVHIDGAAAQQGVSRFLEMPPHWRYSKKEGQHDMLAYTHLVSENATVPGFTAVIGISGVDFTALLDVARGARRSPLNRF
ncbi:hypothetical protein T484DRAFT_1835244 [Baffinella frigidus]|nr:hypothetical protein T484DRAFT_1835244 [Cryptophyta sp. CCMP2293]